MLVPIGPVAVFGSSNFPFAFSVAGRRHRVGARRRQPGRREGALLAPRRLPQPPSAALSRRGARPTAPRTACRHRLRHGGRARPRRRPADHGGRLHRLARRRPRAARHHRAAARADPVLRRAQQPQPARHHAGRRARARRRDRRGLFGSFTLGARPVLHEAGHRVRALRRRRRASSPGWPSARRPPPRRCCSTRASAPRSGRSGHGCRRGQCARCSHAVRTPVPRDSRRAPTVLEIDAADVTPTSPKRPSGRSSSSRATATPPMSSRALDAVPGLAHRHHPLASTTRRCCGGARRGARAARRPHRLQRLPHRRARRRGRSTTAARGRRRTRSTPRSA